MRTRHAFRLILAGLVLHCWAGIGWGQAGFITLASTTSTEQSGLFAHLLPAFEKASGIHVRVVALGTGQALDLARRGDADVVFVHDPAAEEKFVADGYGVQRRQVMYNDFILVGPKDDPAGVRGQDILTALQRIATARAPFVSRGDHSGTHAAELRYWTQAGIDLERQKGPWYRATGSSMGAALNIAAALNAYLLCDRGTWLNFKNRGRLALLVAGDRRLFNQYSVMLVNPAKHPHVKQREGLAFIDWLVSSEGQQTIAAYRIGAEPVFFPNASQ